MKFLIVTVFLCTSFNLFAQNIFESDYCRGRGQSQINKHKAFIEKAMAKGETSEELQQYWQESLVKMQENHDWLCKGIQPAPTSKLSRKEAQMKLIEEGVAAGQINEETADFLLESLSKM